MPKNSSGRCRTFGANLVTSELDFRNGFDANVGIVAVLQELAGVPAVAEPK